MSLLVASTVPLVLQQDPKNRRQFNLHKSVKSKFSVMCSVLFFSLTTSNTFFEVVRKHDTHHLKPYAWPARNSIAQIQCRLKNEGLLRIGPSYIQVRKWNIGLIQVQNILLLCYHFMLPLVREFLITGLFISPSGISELDCATTKTDTAERSISIGRESLQGFFLY